MEDERIIIFNGEVNEISSLIAITQLLDFNAEDKTKPIYMYINSPGGSIIHGLAVYDTIKHIEAPVYTICTGLAASMGAFLLSCGAKGHRSATKHSRILIHQPLISTERPSAAKESQLRELAKDLQKDRELLESIIANNTDQPIEKVHKDCERDNWLDTKQALEYHIIDHII